MGLKLTLNAENNAMGFTFVDAYWHIESLRYEMGDALLINFSLNCYPTREASKLTNKDVKPMDIGMPEKAKYDGKLYTFYLFDYASKVFPNGMPLDRDSQLAQIYTFIKEYTGLPFEDVFEEKEEAAEPTVEPVVDPEPEIPAEELYTEPVVDEPISEVIEPDTVQTEEIVPYYFAESEETEGQSEEPEEVTEETETETEPEAEPEPEPEIYHNPLQL